MTDMEKLTTFDHSESVPQAAQVEDLRAGLPKASHLGASEIQPR